MSRIAIAFAAAAIAAAAPLVQAGAEPLSVRENFRIGSGGSVLCTAQSLGNDKGLKTMFDRGYSVVCRDAVAPIRMQLQRIGRNLNQAMKAGNAAMMADSGLQIDRELRRIADMREEINEQIAQFVPGVPLAHPAPSLAFDPRVTTYPASPVNDEVFNMIELSE